MSTREEDAILAPTPNPETQPFWDAAKEGRFLIRRCESCGEAHFYPRTMCPFCHSMKTDWHASKGEGRIYSCTVMRRAAAPYVLAYVELAEGPRVLTRVVDCDADKVEIGSRVRMVFKQAADGFVAPMFTLSSP